MDVLAAKKNKNKGVSYTQQPVFSSRKGKLEQRCLSNESLGTAYKLSIN